MTITWCQEQMVPQHRALACLAVSVTSPAVHADWSAASAPQDSATIFIHKHTNSQNIDKTQTLSVTQLNSLQVTEMACMRMTKGG